MRNTLYSSANIGSSDLIIGVANEIACWCVYVVVFVVVVVCLSDCFVIFFSFAFLINFRSHQPQFKRSPKPLLPSHEAIGNKVGKWPYETY